jgi:hypothetical protein
MIKFVTSIYLVCQIKKRSKNKLAELGAGKMGPGPSAGLETHTNAQAAQAHKGPLPWAHGTTRTPSRGTAAARRRLCPVARPPPDRPCWPPTFCVSPLSSSTRCQARLRPAAVRAARRAALAAARRALTRKKRRHLDRRAASKWIRGLTSSK